MPKENPIHVAQAATRDPLAVKSACLESPMCYAVSPLPTAGSEKLRVGASPTSE